MNVKIILNEQHSLLDNQKEVLEERYGDDYEIFSVPAKGWTVEEMDKISEELEDENLVIFASPVPYLLMKLTYRRGLAAGVNMSSDEDRHSAPVGIFHNDHRKKKERSEERTSELQSRGHPVC